MPTRNFFELTTDNASECNLTELNAAETVDSGFVSHNDWLSHVNRYAYVMKRLLKSDTSSLLDVGCGRMQLPYFLWKNRARPQNQEFAYWGLELRAQRKWLPAEDQGWKVPINLVKTDILVDSYDQLPGWPGQFDTVVCFETFEHVPREAAPGLMRRLFEWTKPGGTCLFSTPNAGVSNSTAENHLDDDGVSREWTFEEKLSVAAQAGFTVEETFGTFCGTTRLPEEVQDRFESDLLLRQAKKFLSHAAFTTLVCAAYPSYSNNALFHMVRPA